VQRNYGFLPGDVSFKCLYLYEKERKERKEGVAVVAVVARLRQEGSSKVNKARLTGNDAALKLALYTVFAQPFRLTDGRESLV
jgi:hypothetical protein